MSSRRKKHRLHLLHAGWHRGMTALLFIAALYLLITLAFRLWYELQGPLTADTPLYFAVGRGILNGQIPYRDLFEFKPPGIFLLSALAFSITAGTLMTGVFQAITIAAFPVIFIFFAWMERKKTSRTWLPILLAALFGIMLALYAAERSGEFQVESFGALPAVAAVLVMLQWDRTKKKGWIMFNAFLLLASIGFKEPFIFTIAAAAGILFADSPKKLWRALLLPLIAAGVTGIVLMFLLRYAGPYLSIYLPEMTGSYTHAFNSPWMRAWQWNKVFWDLWLFNIPLALTVCFLGITYVLQGACLGFRGFFLRLSVLLCAIYGTTYAIGLGGTFYNHHFVFALPFYAALFGRYQEDTTVHPQTPSVRISNNIMIALLLLAACVTPLSWRYEERLSSYKATERSARETAETVDRILTACSEPTYLFFGGNGIQPFGFTIHSPLGPYFFQLPYFNDHPALRYREQLLRALRQAQIVVVQQLPPDTLRPTIEAYLRQNFSQTPWPCAMQAGPVASPYTLLFRSR